nr:MAG TPA: hypothetical protein [Caudoviricetes sp.]
MLHEYIKKDTFLSIMQHEMQHEIFWMGGVSIISNTPYGVCRKPFPTSEHSHYFTPGPCSGS